MSSPRRAHLLHEAFELSLGVKAATAASNSSSERNPSMRPNTG